MCIKHFFLWTTESERFLVGKAGYQSHTIFGLVMNGDATLALMRLKFFDVFEDVSNEGIGL